MILKRPSGRPKQVHDKAYLGARPSCIVVRAQAPLICEG